MLCFSCSAIVPRIGQFYLYLFHIAQVQNNQVKSNTFMGNGVTKYAVEVEWLEKIEHTCSASMLSQNRPHGVRALSLQNVSIACITIGIF